MDNGRDTATFGAGTASGLNLTPSCDVCGRDVTPDDYYSAELTASGAMCPSPMTFHKACFEAASTMWYPDPDSYCTVDPLFPETAQWASPASPAAGAAGEAGA